MANPDVVNYLRQLINKHPVDDLRKQLTQEGISEADFDEALKLVLKTPLPKERKPGMAGKIFLGCGVGLVAVIAILALVFQKPSEAEPKPQVQEGAFLGKSGYVIRLPEGYSAHVDYKDEKQTLEVIHFSKAGIDPTNFLNENLFGQLGIIRLEVEPNRFAESPNAMAYLTKFLENLMNRNNYKYSMKTLTVSSLKGLQVTIQVPFQRTEAYVLGEKKLYLFTAGQDDEIYREIVLSLRETGT